MDQDTVPRRTGPGRSNCHLRPVPKLSPQAAQLERLLDEKGIAAEDVYALIEIIRTMDASNTMTEGQFLDLLKEIETQRSFRPST